MQVTYEHLQAIAWGRTSASKVKSNINSICTALNEYGKPFGMLEPHRLAHILAQIAHETAGFLYDREIWGPTAAQKRYDIRTDLGNTPERDGDGKKNSGKGPFHLTGRYNIGKFHSWCISQGFNPPDFVKDPELINTDPWEGLSVVFYWSSHSLNRFADINDIEMVRRRINGGLNGFADVLTYYTRSALVLLGRHVGKTSKSFVKSIRLFQADAKADGTYKGEIDGDDGPKTRAALHAALVKLGTTKETQVAPVVVDKEVKVPTAPKQTEKPAKDVWTMIVSFVTPVVGWVAGLDPIAQVALIAFGAIGVALVVSGRINLAKSARQIREALEG
jgi:putative chitinase